MGRWRPQLEEKEQNTQGPSGSPTMVAPLLPPPVEKLRLLAVRKRVLPSCCLYLFVIFSCAEPIAHTWMLHLKTFYSNTHTGLELVTRNVLVYVLAAFELDTLPSEG